jgi:site-specific recombinase XerD
MSELEREIGRYLEELVRAQSSPHTLESYGVDLRQFLEYFTPPDSDPPPLAQIGVLEIREWLADLYAGGLAPYPSGASWRRCARCSVFFRARG